MKNRGRDIEEIKRSLISQYGIDSSWFAGAFDKSTLEKDSIENLRTEIILEDLPIIKPNVKLTIFDACYNGDFRNKSFIANEYIFSEGGSIACFANSVNVLQDKSATDLMGLLSCGFKLGEWTKNVNILESHIIGDPTFRFARPKNVPKIRTESRDTSYWKAVLGHKLPIDLHSLALYKLADLNYPGISDILLDIYKTSKSYTQRLQCLHLLAFYNDNNYSQLLKLAMDDPYEFIRRKATYYMGRVGKGEFIPHLIKLYLEDNLSERVVFNALSSLEMFNKEVVDITFKRALKEASYIHHIEDVEEYFNLRVLAPEKIKPTLWADLIDETTTQKQKEYFLITLRNNPASDIVPDILYLLSNKNEATSFRITLAELLGWYERSYCKEQIIDSCKKILNSEKELEPALKDELQKTINRLQTYMK